MFETRIQIFWQNSPTLIAIINVCWVENIHPIFWLLEDTTHTHSAHKSFTKLGQFLWLSNGKSLSIWGQHFLYCLLLRNVVKVDKLFGSIDWSGRRFHQDFIKMSIFAIHISEKHCITVCYWMAHRLCDSVLDSRNSNNRQPLDLGCIGCQNILKEVKILYKRVHVV